MKLKTELNDKFPSATLKGWHRYALALSQNAFGQIEQHGVVVLPRLA
jgi:hypothetical protein